MKHSTLLPSLALLALALPAAAATFESGGLYYTTTGTSTVAVAPVPTEQASTQPYAGRYIIPEQVYYDGTNYKVTSIADQAFYRSHATEVQIPNSVTTIGDQAFTYDDYLASITLPINLKKVGQGLLDGTSVTNVAVPEGITKLPSFTFQSCTRLHTVLLPSTLKSIGSYGFNNCHQLAEIYCAAPTPPDASAWAIFIALKGIDVIVPDDQAVAAYKKNAVWGNDTTFTLYPNEDLEVDMTPKLEKVDDNWMRVQLGGNLAYKIYNDDDELIALTAADYYYLPVRDRNVTYTIVPTTMMGDGDPVTVTVNTTGLSRVAAEPEQHPIIWAWGGTIHIFGDNYGTWTRVWDMYGQLCYERPSGQGEISGLPRHRVYIVMVGNYVQKIML